MDFLSHKKKKIGLLVKPIKYRASLIFMFKQSFLIFLEIYVSEKNVQICCNAIKHTFQT